MCRVLFVVWLGFAVWAATFVQGAESPAVVAVPAPTPPVLDGRLDDPVWQHGPWYSDFKLLGEGGKLAAAQTRFKVAYDAEKLYLAIEAFEPNMAQLVARETKRDGHVHRDDVLEFMIVPGSVRQEYYHFSVNPLGTLYDAERRQGGYVATAEWDADWQAAIGRTPQSWIVEAAVPFCELPLTGLAKGDWAINVARERQAGEKELSSYAEGRGGFHEPNLYPSLRLAGADIGRYLWRVRGPYEIAFAGENGQLLYTGCIHLTNETGRFFFVRVLPELLSPSGRSEGATITVGLDATQARELRFRVPVREQGAQILRFTIADRRDPQHILAVRRCFVTLAYTPLWIEITQPAYRDCIYATQQIKTIEFVVHSALEEATLRGKQLRAMLVAAEGKNAPEKPLAEAKAPARPEVVMRLPATGLATGDYRLMVALVNKRGEIEQRAEKRLRKLPPAPSGHEWRIDEHNVLLHNGQPFLPFGWFSQPPETFDPADGYTVLQNYNQQYYSDEEVRAWLDQVAARGAFALIYPYSRGFMNRREDGGKPLEPAEKEELARRVRALRDHPGLLGWYMADEPELVPVLPQRAREIYEVVREADPYHPCVMLNDTIEGIRRYAIGGDVLMPDPYPCFLKGGLAASPIEKTSQYVRAVREATGGRKPAWVTPQAFNYGDFGKANNRAPTLVELRNQAVQAIVYGGKGFIWYTYSQIHNYPALWLGMPFLAREMRDLQEAILAPDMPQVVRVEAPKPEHLHVAARRVGADLFIFAVNTATEAQEVTFFVKQAPPTLAVVSEGRRVNLAKGRFTDRFAIYESHIYSTRLALAERESLAQTLAAIAQADAARKKPGNLAFEDSGVRVVVSSGATYGNTPDRVVDGITEYMGWTAKEASGEQWLMLIWPQPQRIGRVVVYSTSLAEADVQVPGPTPEAWHTVGRLTGSGPLSAVFAPVETDRLRVVARKLRPEARVPGLQEIEAYAE